MARFEIATLVRRFNQLEQEIESITQHLVELVQTSVEYEWLSTVQGLGDTTIANSARHCSLVINVFLAPTTGVLQSVSSPFCSLFFISKKIYFIESGLVRQRSIR
jgi:hypothetical protein